MAGRRRSAALVRRQPQRRRRIWARSTGVLAGITGSGTIFSPLTTFESEYAADLVGSTIARIRLDATGRTTAQVNVQPMTRWGIIVGPESLDVTDLDDASALHADWMFWRRVPSFIDRSAVTFVYNLEVDVKAMRKMEELGETLLVSVFPDSGDTWTINYGVSTLLLLP